MNTATILKRIHLTTAIVITALLIATLILIFYRPVPSSETIEQKNRALEELRQAQTNLTLAKLDSIRFQQETANNLALKKDQELTDRLKENTKALNNARDEKIHTYTDYNSEQLQYAVSELIRQYKAKQ